MSSWEVIVQSGPKEEVILFDKVNVTVGELRSTLSLQKGDIIFPGGKKLKDTELIPFDPSTKRVKCRVFGAISVKPPPQEQVQHQEQQIQAVVQSSKEEIDNVSSLLVKGLSGIEFHIPLANVIMSYGDIKVYLVSKGHISDPRSIRLLSKGGITPSDTDKVVPGIVRAIRTEFGHDDILKKLDLEQVAKQLDEAEKVLKSITSRLLDTETIFLESRRLESEMKNIVNFLDGRRGDLKKRAEGILDKLKN